MPMQMRAITTVLLVLFMLAGCSNAELIVTPTAILAQPDPTDTLWPTLTRTSTATATSSPTPLPPTQTSTPSPTLAPTSTSTPVPFPTLSGGGIGMIVFASWERSDWQIYTVNADGSGQKQVTVGVRGGYEPSWSPDGAKIVFQYNGLKIADIASGEIQRIPLSVEEAHLENEYLVKPAWSPDGKWIAFLNESGIQGDIYLIRPDGTDLSRLTDSNDISRDGNLVWSPDGKQLAYSSGRDGNIEIYILDVAKAFQGMDASQQLTDSLPPTRNLVGSWSPDGSRIAFSSDRDGNTEIYLMNADGSNIIRLTNDPASDLEPSWSPDGKLIAFSSNRDGNIDIYVMDVNAAIQSAGNAYVWRLTDHPGDDVGPAWRPMQK